MSQAVAVPRDGRLADSIARTVGAARVAGVRLRAVAELFGSVVTPLGWSILAVVVLCFVAGYSLGWTELVAVGWAGLVLIGAASGYLIGRTAYVISLAMPVDRVVVGDRVPGQVVVHNPTRRRLPGVHVEVPVGAGLAEFAMPGLARDSSFDDVFIVPTRRRGVIPVGPVRTVRADPIGLVRKERVWAERIELFVHPRTISIPSMSTGFIRDLEGNPTKDLTSSDVSFHALREYVRGDERRNIHWKSTAKTGTYMVRQFEETRRSHLMVALSLAESDYATDDDFEMAVSVAGSLGVRAIRDGRTVSVVAGDKTAASGRSRGPALRTLSTLTRTRLLDDLSRVETSPRALALAGLARAAAESMAGISVAFLVCGSRATLAELRAASTRFPAGVEVVAVVCDPESVPSLRRVAELSVLTIGFLDDLQKSLARTAGA
ncbi:Uncharacterized conserved protein, DUF58 family, contains vWF domain [Cryobacterium psychrotolerans]|uniref:Uncharacterized conserved protein, DUF58 family, contains vWF domain n=1 Tax=Cryobacterium psychrotolerans TaxID=386301 RepID=A0A1G8YTR4_9MICO|nr:MULTISPECIES: DUF58 domain-containing protein [Cryobacterium]TFD43281.1 DUF58 domain-containing protein [Cryobacterium sp. TMT1-2-1]TFD85660.1 DUF58 domain-containing protein [Cryobacterium psychrotolerans]SDK06242.1 Uncharacterized conserved protein, DUF58 family, contains vWF domain [Cryobacterium psychrotolerans]